MIHPLVSLSSSMVSRHWTSTRGGSYVRNKERAHEAQDKGRPRSALLRLMAQKKV